MSTEKPLSLIMLCLLQACHTILHTVFTWGRDDDIVTCWVEVLAVLLQSPCSVQLQLQISSEEHMISMLTWERDADCGLLG